MKKFLICLSLLFSSIFIGNVKAASSDFYDMSKWIDIDEFTLPNGINPDDYNIFIFERGNNGNSNSYRMVYSLKSDNYKLWLGTRSQYLPPSSFPYLDASYGFSKNRIGGYDSIYFYDESTLGSKNFTKKQSSAGLFNFGPYIVYSNYDIYYENGEKLFDTSKINYDSNPQPNTFNFHLNGGHVYDDRPGFEFENWDDFSFTLYGDEIEDFFTNLKVEKATMIFEGWYYDANFNNPFNITDNITSDVDLYAKFRYEKVDDFLNNTNFTEYTFDTLYNYAIITKGNNSGDIYLGINSNRYDITVYEYIENLSNYDNEKGFCLVPIYSKNETYYYLLDTTKTLNTEVLVLPKSTFENNDYKFLLTDNAYVTYTNNLEETTIYDSNGNQINTNLEETYQTFQDSMISEENDLLTIFKNLTGLKDNNIFNNINSLWNKFKGTPIYNYLMILIVGSLIILIIKAAKRK